MFSAPNSYCGEKRQTKNKPRKESHGQSKGNLKTPSSKESKMK